MRTSGPMTMPGRVHEAEPRADLARTARSPHRPSAACAPAAGGPRALNRGATACVVRVSPTARTRGTRAMRATTSGNQAPVERPREFDHFAPGRRATGRGDNSLNGFLQSGAARDPGGGPRGAQLRLVLAFELSPLARRELGAAADEEHGHRQQDVKDVGRQELELVTALAKRGQREGRRGGTAHHGDVDERPGEHGGGDLVLDQLDAAGEADRQSAAAKISAAMAMSAPGARHDDSGVAAPALQQVLVGLREDAGSRRSSSRRPRPSSLAGSGRWA